jgi:hypothetical protein
VASTNTGGWVRRVGAAGGGRTYRKRRPINFYGVVVTIVVLGIGSVGWARYEYTHHTTVAAPNPTSQALYEALGINVCGREQPPLPANSAVETTGFGALAGGAIEVHPTTDADSGPNATLAKFVDSYPGLVVSKSELVIPAAHPTAKHPTNTYLAGSVCPKGTPDAGKSGQVVIATWADIGSTKPKLYTEPSKVHFTPVGATPGNMLITIAFVPSGTIPPKPPATAIGAMLSPPTTTTTTTSTSTTTTTSPATPTTSG